jgi:hypothetical protein
MAEGGYSTVVEGIVGPWHLDEVRDVFAPGHLVVRYVVLRPTLESCQARAMERAGEERVPGHPALTEEGPIRHMWHQFERLGAYERCVLDSTDLDAAETARQVRSWLADAGRLLSVD